MVKCFRKLPASLTRGDTYYIADGSYGGYTFDDPASSTQIITIKKAVASDHGTGTGWQTAYGDGQAVFTGGLTFATSHWFLDGMSGSETSGYGIVAAPSSPSDIIVFFGTVSDITIRHVEARNYVDGTAMNGMTVFAMALKATTGTTSDITLQNNYFHHIYGCQIQGTAMQNWIVEGNYFSNNRSTAEMHAAFLCDQGGDDNTFFNNIFKDISGSAILDLIEGPDTANGYKFYNNVVWHTDAYGSSLASIIGVWNDASNERTAINWKVYGNSFVNLKGYASLYFAGSGSDIDIKNNYWYCNRTDDSYSNYAYISGSGITYDYNYYSACAHPGAFEPATHEPPLDWGPNCKLSRYFTDPFVNWQSGDFHLSRATDAGGALSGYNKDMIGVTRGFDGVWDRGAFEYTSGDGDNTAPASPSGLFVR